MYDIAVYGLGIMGSSLAKNFLDKGFRVALFSKYKEELERFAYDENKNWKGFTDEKALLSSLNDPRIVFLMITAGDAVDRVIEELLPYLSAGDILIDGGNSFYKDTNRRLNLLKKKNILYLGVGVSGGEKGARTGPSMMAGGSMEGWRASKHILQKIAAHYDNEPCCGYVGPEGAGHYVKMVHNGIEYAIMQLLADIYFIMKHGLKLEHDAIVSAFRDWNTGRLNSYLQELTVTVLSKQDADNTPLVDKILDVARQKGTGNWALEEAISRGVYLPTISEAVFFRHFSANHLRRKEGYQKSAITVAPVEMVNYLDKLKDALLAGILCSYAQGIELIKKASNDNGWQISLSETVSLWRAGCIIRSPILEEIREALTEDAQNILLTEKLSYIADLEPSWREVAIQAQRAALPVPTLISTLLYYDCLNAEKLSTNLVQALRDCFGAHTYERIDMEGTFHTIWE